MWNKTFLQILDVFYASRKRLFCINDNLLCFLYVLRLFNIFSTGVTQVLGTKEMFHIENVAIVGVVLSVLFNYELQGSAV